MYTPSVSGLFDSCGLSISSFVASVSVTVGGREFSLQRAVSLVVILLNFVPMATVCVSPFWTVSGVWKQTMYCDMMLSRMAA